MENIGKDLQHLWEALAVELWLILGRRSLWKMMIDWFLMTDLASISDKLRLISIQGDSEETSDVEMVKSDEELARMLQAEEDAMMFQQFVAARDSGGFEGRVRPYVSQVLMYEDPVRQEAARKTVPKDELEEKALVSLAKVPTMYTRLIQGYEAMDKEMQESSSFAAQKLRLMMSGSAALPRPVMHQWESITGHRLLERYGMTEFVMAISNPLRGERKAGTVGKPLPSVEAIIREDENDSNGVGEICVKSPSLFKEYWNLPEVTKETFTEDGYFKTGDAGRVDEDGYYVILGCNSADIIEGWRIHLTL